MPDASDRGTHTALASGFADYDALVAAIRDRISTLQLSYGLVEDLAEMSNGALSKYLADARIKRLTVESLMRLAAVTGVRCAFVEDPAQLLRMRPHYEVSDRKKAHHHRAAPVSPATVRRMRPAVLAAFAKEGAAARNQKLSPQVRSELARAAALARWRGSRDLSPHRASPELRHVPHMPDPPYPAHPSLPAPARATPHRKHRKHRRHNAEP